MSKIAKARKLAAQIGATIEYDKDIGRLSADIESGLVFIATGCHTCCHDFERGPWANESIQDLIDDLDMGVRPCDQDDCDICGEA